MTPKDPAKSQSAKLRRRTQKVLVDDADKLRRRTQKSVAKRAKSAVSRPSGDASRLIHELEVHQVELELQKGELFEAKAKLEATYNELYDCAPVGYFTLDARGAIRKLNLSGARMLGRERSHLIGKRFSDFVAAASRDRFQLFLRRLSSGQGKEGCLVTLMKANNVPRAAYIPVAVYIEASASEYGYRAVVVDDITSYRQAELAQHHSEARLKLAVAASQLGVWEWDCGAKEIYWSLECWRIFGVDQLTIPLALFLGLVHRQDRARVRKLFGPMQEEQAVQSIEYRIIRPDGALVWISSLIQVQFDEDGRPRCVIGTAQDITERKRAEQDASPEALR